MSSSVRVRGVFLVGLCLVVVLSVGAVAQVSGECGDLDASGAVGATDALLLLKKAVGQNLDVFCPPCPASVSRVVGVVTDTCGDLDGSGSIGATDALLLLKRAVGQPVTLACPTCSSTTTTTLAVPETCGNGVVDVGEECEREQGCADDQYCNAACSCESAGYSSPTSQELIAAALERGDIDYPTSLLYRVWALFQDARLAEEYDGAGAAREDGELFYELANMRGFLPAAIEAEVAPYLVRPDDPTSIFSQPPVALLSLGAAMQSATAQVGCANNAYGVPDWRYFETENFVVWSCGGGINGSDPDGTKRLVVGAIAEDVYGRMKPKLGTLKPDNNLGSPQPIGRTDIYILTLNQCREREGFCNDISGGANAAHVPAPPCGRSAGGPLTISGYFIVPANKVPASAPGPDISSNFRGTLTHEMFHRFQGTINAEARGYACTPTGDPDRVGRTWLTEAGATWAEFAFTPQDYPAFRSDWFEFFQTRRQPYSEGLQVVAGQHPGKNPSYASFIYHTFLQQEMYGDPQFLFDFWTGSTSARTPRQLDERLNAAMPFTDHFRDFAVRNINRVGKGVLPLYASLDSAIQPGLPPRSLVFTSRLEGAAKNDWAAWIGPLSAWQDSFKIAPEVRWVRFDITPELGHEHARIDVLANVGGTWTRRKITGPIFEFCRDDPGDDISELYFVISNHAFQSPELTVTGDYQTETKLACPKGWSGYIHLTSKLTRNSYEDFGGGSWSSVERTQREEHTWTVASTSDFFGAEQLNTGWVAQREVYEDLHDSSGACGESHFLEEGHGNGLDSTEFLASPNGDGSFMLTPYKFEASAFDVETTYTSYPCDAPMSVASGTETFYEQLGLLSGVQELVVLTPDADDATEFRGSATIVHEETDLPGGKEINDISVDWSLKRRP
jgi:hypothetical protein